MEEKRKTSLVTGGNRGIGLAVVEGLAALGYRVLLGSRKVTSGEEAASGIKGDVIPVPLDLSHRETLKGQVGTLLDKYSIDVLVNNAGILEQGSLLSVKEEKFDQSMRVNFEAPFDLVRMIVPGMIQRKYGRVVNLSSGWGSFGEGLNGPAAYAVSKAAFNALTLTRLSLFPKK